MTAFAPDLRARSLAALRGQTVDVLILGGGINGAGIARDLCLRQHPLTALRIALVEQRHFSSGTSGKNSQLIHGGLRYLKYLKMGLVKESLRERATLRRIAPHLVQPLSLLLPVYSRLDKIKYLMGLRMYDQLAGAGNIGKHREVSRAEIEGLEPRLNFSGLAGGAVFYDCAVHSARLVLENLFDAAAHGALIANYTHARPLQREADGTWRVLLDDALTGERFLTSARKLVDATGAWSQPESGAPRLVRGSHLVLPRLNQEDHAIAYFGHDGRIIFFIPWGSKRQLTLVGTTDIDHRDGPDRTHMSLEEMNYLMSVVGRVYPRSTGVAPISCFSSLRPLVSDGSASATSASREHRIFNTSDGILRIQGGKYTTYRSMSEEAGDAIASELAPEFVRAHKTATEPLSGNSEKALGKVAAEMPRLAAHHRLPVEEVERLARDYGVHLPDLMALMPERDYGAVPRVECAQMAFAVQHEMAARLGDYMFVSTYRGYESAWDAPQLDPYACVMGSWLHWDEATRASQVQTVLEQVALPR